MLKIPVPARKANHPTFCLGPHIRCFLLQNPSFVGLVAGAQCLRGNKTPQDVCANPYDPCNKQYAQACGGDTVCCPSVGTSKLACEDGVCVPYCDPAYDDGVTFIANDCGYKPCQYSPANYDCTTPSFPPAPPKPPTGSPPPQVRSKLYFLSCCRSHEAELL